MVAAGEAFVHFNPPHPRLKGKTMSIQAINVRNQFRGKAKAIIDV